MRCPALDERGLSLIEIIVSVALLGLAAGGLIGAISVGLRASVVLEEQATVASVATSQLERIRSREYSEPADYVSGDLPDGYSVTLDGFVDRPTLLERITVGVYNADGERFGLTTHKVNPAFVASPASQVLAQRDFRWYESSGQLTPDVPLAAYSVTEAGEVLRLKISVQAYGVALRARTHAFRLQYASNQQGPWSEVGDIGSAEGWRGFDNARLPDGAPLSGHLLERSMVAQSYEEEGPSVANPVAVGAGEWAEWDWVMQENGAEPASTYLFRMVRADGTPLESYTRYPTLVVPPR